MEIYRVHLQKLCKKGGRSRGLVGLGLPNHSVTGRKRLRKWNHIQKVKCTVYPVNWTWKLIELEKKDPLSASFKMLESSTRLQNRKAIKALIIAIIRCTHFLAHQHILLTWQTSWIGSEVWWRDSSNLPWQSWRKCNVHFKNGCTRVCECSWNMGGRVSTQATSLGTLF